MSKARGCAGGLILGSALRAIIFIVSALIKALASIMVFFGLWAPFFYAILGGILFLVFGFDPFSGSIDSKIYLAGFGATVLCALLLTIKHLFEKPAESVAEGFKKPIWKSRSDTDSEEPRPRYEKRRYYDDEDDYPRQKSPRRPVAPDDYAPEPPPLAETPRIYYSAREKDTLVHEYNDRFEVFRVKDGRPVLDKVEYKNL